MWFEAGLSYIKAEGSRHVYSLDGPSIKAERWRVRETDCVCWPEYQGLLCGETGEHMGCILKGLGPPLDGGHADTPP